MTNQENFQKPFFTIIPFSVRNDKNLSNSEKLFYGDLVGLAREEGYCFATNQWLAQTFSICERQVKRWIHKLIEHGYIEATYSECGFKRKIWILEGFSKNVSPGHFCPGGRTKMSRILIYPNNRERKSFAQEPEKPQEQQTTSELPPEKQELFETLQADIPEDVLPHDEILDVLQETSVDRNDVAAAIKFIGREILRNKKKRGGSKINSYVAIFRSKVSKLRKLRLYNQKTKTKVNL